mmetsp:Transcript_6649/g.14360  ORF Transcript_6649/g.14360 Transcript_6649/m.14360 type:complete len:150 (+) Transcript_6649:72-521(+)
MDTTAMNIWKQTLEKEGRFHTKWAREREERTGRKSPAKKAGESMMQSGPSAASHYVDQTLGISQSPFDRSKPKADDMLYYGVSSEGQGRVAYLKARTREGPQEKYGAPRTSSHVVGWSAPIISTAGSAFARKPLVRETFYRPNGVHNHD